MPSSTGSANPAEVLFTPLFVDGAVIEAVNGTLPGASKIVTFAPTLGSEPSLLNGSAAVHRIATLYNQAWTGSDPFSVLSVGGWSPVTTIGSSLRVGAEGSTVNGATSFMVQSNVHEGVLSLTFEETGAQTDHPHVIDYRVTLADGRALPDWLERPSIDLLRGHRAADAETVDLSVTAVYSDGTQLSQSVRVHALTGVIETLPGRRAAITPTLFSRQFAAEGNLSGEQSEALAAILLSVK